MEFLSVVRRTSAVIREIGIEEWTWREACGEVRLRGWRRAVRWGAEAEPTLIVHVHLDVRPESVADFRQATLENARSSVQEPRIARFDVVEQQDDATRFVLIEIYRSPGAAAAHKETAHFANDEGNALITAQNAAAAAARGRQTGRG